MTDNLKNYVVKSYAKCQGKKNYEREMTGLLKKLINEAKMMGDLNTRNWKLFPPPQLSHEKPNTISLNNNFPLPQLNMNQFAPQIPGIRM